MKKWILISFSLFCLNTFSQRGLEIGPRWNPHISSVKVKQDQQSLDQNILTRGLDWGLEVGYSTRLQRSVRSGIYFSESGDAFVRDSKYYSRKVNYMEIPMQFKFITDPFYIYMFSFYIGPQFKMKTNAFHEYVEFDSNEEALEYARNNRNLKAPSNESKMNYYDIYGVNFYNTENLYRTYSMDLSLGLGFDYPLNGFILFHSYFKYDLSLLNMENKTYEITFRRFWTSYWTPSYERGIARNYDFGFMFGVTLILPKRW